MEQVSTFSRILSRPRYYTYTQRAKRGEKDYNPMITFSSFCARAIEWKDFSGFSEANVRITDLGFGFVDQDFLYVTEIATSEAMEYMAFFPRENVWNSGNEHLRKKVSQGFFSSDFQNNAGF